MRPRELAAALVKAKAPVAGLPRGVQPAGLVYGVVQSIQDSSTGGTPPSVTVTLAGSATSIAGVRFISSYYPVVSDTVVIAQMGSDLMVLASLGTNGASHGQVIGYASTSGSTGSITTIADIAGVSTTVTLLAGRRYKIKGLSPLTSTVASDTLTLAIRVGSTIWEQCQMVVNSTNQITYQVERYVQAATSPSGTDQIASGSTTFKLSAARTVGTGTANSNPGLFGSNDRAFISVEDAGPW